MNIPYRVDLSDEEHAQLTAMLNGGKVGLQGDRAL